MSNTINFINGTTTAIKSELIESRRVFHHDASPSINSIGCSLKSTNSSNNNNTSHPQTNFNGHSMRRIYASNLWQVPNGSSNRNNSWNSASIDNDVVLNADRDIDFQNISENTSNQDFKSYIDNETDVNADSSKFFDINGSKYFWQNKDNIEKHIFGSIGTMNIHKESPFREDQYGLSGSPLQSNCQELKNSLSSNTNSSSGSVSENLKISTFNAGRMSDNLFTDSNGQNTIKQKSDINLRTLSSDFIDLHSNEYKASPTSVNSPSDISQNNQSKFANGPARLINLNLRSCFNCINVIDKYISEVVVKLSSINCSSFRSAPSQSPTLEDPAKQFSLENRNFSSEYKNFMSEVGTYFDSKISYSRSPSKIDNLLKKVCTLQCEILFITTHLELISGNLLSETQRDTIRNLDKPISDLQWTRNCERIIGASDTCLLDLARKLGALTNNLEQILAIFFTIKNLTMML